MITLDTVLGQFDTYDTGTVTRALQSRGNWDEHVGEALQRAEPGGWALDLGAHIGWFTVLLSRRHEHVIAVEPFPQTFELLRRNLQMYHGGLRETVACWPVAAYSRVRALAYTPLGSTDNGANCYIPYVPGQTGLPVAGVALDPYIPPTADVRVIKVDCQGADLHALQGLAHTIARCRPLIVLEWEEALAGYHGHDWRTYQAWAARMGYRLDRITPHFWDYVAVPIG